MHYLLVSIISTYYLYIIICICITAPPGGLDPGRVYEVLVQVVHPLHHALLRGAGEGDVVPGLRWPGHGARVSISSGMYLPGGAAPCCTDPRPPRADTPARPAHNHRSYAMHWLKFYPILMYEPFL